MLPDCYDKEELEIQQNTLEEYFQEYRTYTREPTEDQLEAAMEKVLDRKKRFLLFLVPLDVHVQGLPIRDVLWAHLCSLVRQELGRQSLLRL